MFESFKGERKTLEKNIFERDTLERERGGASWGGFFGSFRDSQRRDIGASGGFPELEEGQQTWNRGYGLQLVINRAVYA